MIKIPHSIENSKRKESILKILESAIYAVEPLGAVTRYLDCNSNRIRVENTEYDLDSTSKIVVLGAGKASQSMAAGVHDVLGDRISQGIVIIKHNESKSSIDTGKIDVIEASHPVPDSRAVEGANRILKLAGSLEKSDLAIVLVSGGASSLLTLPADGLNLNDIEKTTDLLLRSGANIEELNAVRRPLSKIKGGRLAEAIYPAKTLTLILSDVVGNKLEVIGSGPTVFSDTSTQTAKQVLQEYQLLSKVPRSVSKHLELDLEEPSESIFANVQNTIIGSNKYAAEAAVAVAEEQGFNVNLVTTTLVGEAREVGEIAAEMARELKQVKVEHTKPACFVLGGETTVTVKGTGKGGRNTELALAAAVALKGMEDILIVAFATDGTDGPTDSAGAVASGNTCVQAKENNLDPMAFLENNDSYSFFDALDDLIITGPTRTNVADLLLIFAF